MFDGIRPEHVQVSLRASRRRLQSGAYIVDVRIMAPDVAAADVAYATLTDITIESLSAAVGVSIESASVTLSEAPPPPPPPRDHSYVLVVVVVVVLVEVIVCMRPTAKK